MPVKPTCMSHALHVMYVLVHVHVLIKADDDAQRQADRVFSVMTCLFTEAHNCRDPRIPFSRKN